MARSNRYVSYLATEIEPQALSTLTQFERATEAAFQRIAAFNDRGAAQLGTSITKGFDGRAQSAISGTSTALEKVSVSATSAKTALAGAGTEANLTATAFFRSAQALNVVQGPLGPLAGRLSSLGYIFRDLAGISLAGVLGGGGAFALASIATGYQNITDRLRPFYDTQVQTNAAFAEVVRIAKESRQALDPVAELYSRIAVAGKDVGVGGAQVGKLTETVAKAARLSGGSAETQQQGITQFTQAFGAGTFQGQDLRAIKDDTFRLAKAIADGLGVPIGRLKVLGETGQLTTAVVVQALARAADQIDTEFTRVPIRIGTAIQQATNNLTVFLGAIDQSTNATTGFAKAITVVGNNIPLLATGIAAVAARFAGGALTTPIAAATRAISDFIATEALINRAGRGAPVTVLTPTGIARAKAATNEQSALEDQRAADQGLRTQNASLFAARERLATAKAEQAVFLAEQRSIDQNARQGEVLAQARVSAAEQELAIANQVAAVRRQSDVDSARAVLNSARGDLSNASSDQAAAEQRAIAARRGVDTADTSGGSRADRARTAATAARTQEVAEAELAAAVDATALASARAAAAEADLASARAASRVPTAAQVLATDALLEAESALSVAIAANTAANEVNAASANASARSGLAILALAEQRIAAEIGLTAATEASAVANATATASTIALSVATEAFTVAAALSTRALALLTAAGRGLSSLLGGPVGIALTVVAGGFTYLATQSDAALDAFDRFKNAQTALQEKLGGTAQALALVSANARQARIDTLALAVDSAKQGKQQAADSLANSLGNATNSLPLFGQDRATIADVVAKLRAGQNTGIQYSDLSAIIQRNPEAFSKGNFAQSAIGGLLGNRPSDSTSKALGFVQTDTELAQAQKALADARASVAKPLAPIDLTPHRTTAQLTAEAGDVATGGTALAQARKDYDKTKADLDAQLAEARGKNDFSFDDKYVQQLAAAQSKLNAVGDAQRAAAAAAREHNKALHEQEAAVKDTIERQTKLATILQKYSDQPSAFNQGQNAQRQVENLFQKVGLGGKITQIPTITVDGEAITKAQALARIIEGMNKPYNDLVRSQQEGLALSALQLTNGTNASTLLKQQIDLERQLFGNNVEGKHLSDEQLTTLRNQLVAQQQITDAIAQRERLIDIEAKAYGNVQAAIRDVLATPLDKNLVKNISSIGDKLVQNFRDSVADKISVTLFGNAEQKARDEMTRGLNTSAANLTTSATNLGGSATGLSAAADALKAAGTAIEQMTNAAGGRTALDGSHDDAIRIAAPDIFPNAKALQNDITGLQSSIDLNTGELQNDIVVTAKRTTAAATGKKSGSIEDRYNQVGQDFATKIFGAGSVFTTAASKLGTFLSGAQYAGVGTGITDALGAKGSSLGAAIGGGLGKTLLGGQDGILSKGLTAISSKLGSFAGPLGSIAGSVIGSLIGGLFKKVDSGTATVSNSGVSSTGTSSQLASNANSLGGQVTGGVNKIAQALGGQVGNYGVSIGTFNGKYRVNDQSTSASLNYNNFSDSTLHDFGTDGQAAAVQYAIEEAIKQGAVKGILAGAQRLLNAGTDLDAQLQKALDFTNVFRQLKQYTDPVGAAIDDLNTQFQGLIATFNEAGASTSDFQALQQLYDLKRADAIKSATNGAVASLQNFVTGLTNSSNSPLSKQTVLANAKASVDAFRSDIAAGKTIDNDALITALGNENDASRSVNGSRQEYFSDFNDIVALANKAQTNITAGVSTNSTAAASPFTDPAVQAKLGVTADATTASAQSLADILAAIQANGYSPDGSSLAFLPGNVSGGGSTSFGGDGGVQFNKY